MEIPKFKLTEPDFIKNRKLPENSYGTDISTWRMTGGSAFYGNTQKRSSYNTSSSNIDAMRFDTSKSLSQYNQQNNSLSPLSDNTFVNQKQEVDKYSKPFDRRLYYINEGKTKASLKIPYDGNKALWDAKDMLSFDGLLSEIAETPISWDFKSVEPGTPIPEDAKNDPTGKIASKDPEMREWLMRLRSEIRNKTVNSDSLDVYKQQWEQWMTESIKKDVNKETGTQSLINKYAIVKFKGSEGGILLNDRRDNRKYYDLDAPANSDQNYSHNPTTSNIISWGNNDKWGRLPYSFTDFVFCKNWNKIPNNRLITLRRYPAPVIDNLRFPQMNSNNPIEKATKFSPIATAVTYFGGSSGNNLKEILKFTTGFEWETAKADIHTINEHNQVVGLNSINQPGGTTGGKHDLSPTSFSKLKKLAATLNVYSGTFDVTKQVMGQVPPNPYTDGPFNNKLQGPIDTIGEVYKRKQGIKFEGNGLKIVFEYNAKPIGGVNTKAVILDIISNFMVMGAASAVFFGGGYRNMVLPPTHPFLGGNTGMKAWYGGKPLDFVKSMVGTFATQGGNIFQDVFKSLKNAISSIMSGDIMGAVNNIFGSNTAGNFTKYKMAEMTAAPMPMLTGTKAILTGEPVGEWHLTIGNPLNPIAVIGNLICETIDYEFGEELGPDDFPMDVKLTVNLKHGMARDRDAVQSMFNRGYGRIYELPDTFVNKETMVDNYTKQESGKYSNEKMKKINLASASRTSVYVGRNTMAGKGSSVYDPILFESSTLSDNNINLSNAWNTRVIYKENEDWGGKFLR